MTSRALVAASILALAALAGCADFERGPAAVVPDAAVSNDAASAGDGGGGMLSFAKDVSPLLMPCTRCHVSGQEAGDTKLIFTGSTSADYATVVMFVDTSAPSSSRLLAKLSGQSHEGGQIYAVDSPEYQTLLHWIQQGASP
jgi:hypothetical protein